MDMRIAGVYNAYSVNNASGTGGAKKTERGSKLEAGKDIFSLSAQAGVFQVAKKAIAALPEIRTDKVNQIKAKIASGDYQVSASDIAAKIVSDSE
jgi:negative regulator of flagellin synthesis FlgM